MPALELSIALITLGSTIITNVTTIFSACTAGTFRSQCCCLEVEHDDGEERRSHASARNSPRPEAEDALSLDKILDLEKDIK